MEKDFLELINLSEKMRPSYKESLGPKTEEWEEIVKKLGPSVPPVYSLIYSQVSGTKRSIEDQMLMDFIPGYRLIHIAELIEEKANLQHVLVPEELPEGAELYPLLANYSSDFICIVRYADGDEKIGLVTNLEGIPEILHNSPESFFKTHCEMYRQEVYFADTDGFLHLDWDKKNLVGAKCNPGISYWEE